MFIFNFKLGSSEVLFSILSLLAHLGTPVVIKVINDPIDPIHYVLDLNVECQLLPKITKHKSFFVLTETCVMLYQNTICTDSNGEATCVHGQTDPTTDSEIPPGYLAYGPCQSKPQVSDSDDLTEQNVSIPKLAKIHVDIYRAELVQRGNKAETTLTLRPQLVVENRGPNSSTHEYKANITIQEFLKIRIPFWIQNITTIQVIGRVEFKERDIKNQFGPYLNAVNIQSHIQTIFTKTAENNNFEPDYSIVHSQNFNVDKSIFVPACIKYNITSSLTVNYWDFGLNAYVFVTGVDVQGQHIPSNILKDMLPEHLTYVGLWDVYTVEAGFGCNIQTEYGNTLKISIKGSAISNC